MPSALTRCLLHVQYLVYVLMVIVTSVSDVFSFMLEQSMSTLGNVFKKIFKESVVILSDALKAMHSADLSFRAAG